MSQPRKGTPSEAAQPIADVFDRILLLAKKLKRMQALTMATAEVSPPQFAVLALLWERDRRPLSELADAHRVSRATMTGHVDNLEKRGLVSRVPNPNDRRSLLAALTRAGKALRRKAPQTTRLFSCCCDGLSPAELGQLHELLEKLERSLAC